MTATVPARVAREASGLPGVETLCDPVRVQVVRGLLDAVEGSALLGGLVALVARVTETSAAQLTLVTDAQVAAAVWPPAPAGEPPVTVPLQHSMCSIAVVSRDVLVAADTGVHPWMSDLPAVQEGVVGAYLGVPLVLPDGVDVGALCVWEPRPRPWSPRDVELVCAVADLVALELQRLAVPVQAPRLG